MCQKQCRDENGFKCHAMSEGHMRNMQLYADNPTMFRERFSNQFQGNFLRELGRSHNTNKVMATQFYNELIQDREHVHMNSTKWKSLTEFILDMSRQGLLRVEETERGWLIQWVDRSGNSRTAEEVRAAREKMDLDDAERDRLRAMAQAKAAWEAKKNNGGDDKIEEIKAADLMRGEGESIGFKLDVVTPQEAAAVVAVVPKEKVAWEEEEEQEQQVEVATKRSKSVLEEIYEKETRKRHKAESEKATAVVAPPTPEVVAKDGGWLRKGLVVKVLNKTISGGEYYKKKGTIVDVHAGGTIGDVEIFDVGDVIRVGMAHLETVLPREGGIVLVLTGKHAGQEAELRRLNVDSFSADVKVVRSGDKLTLPYESICKVSK